ncbi:hypothetical protein BREVUG8_60064 [Brevundimonas sp. G8]|nr:hypothetical protein BREVUG8_60064 [Brevundimonas sp. G8]
MQVLIRVFRNGRKCEYGALAFPIL